MSLSLMNAGAVTDSEIEYGHWVADYVISDKNIKSFDISFENQHDTEPKTVLLSYRMYNYFYGHVHLDTGKRGGHGVDNTGLLAVYIPIEIGNGKSGLFVDWIAIW